MYWLLIFHNFHDIQIFFAMLPIITCPTCTLVYNFYETFNGSRSFLSRFSVIVLIEVSQYSSVLRITISDQQDVSIKDFSSVSQPILRCLKFYTGCMGSLDILMLFSHLNCIILPRVYCIWCTVFDYWLEF